MARLTQCFRLVRVLVGTCFRRRDPHLPQPFDVLQSGLARIEPAVAAPRRTAPIRLPTVKRGLSEVIGSWKIMAGRLPRKPRISVSGRASRSWPPDLMDPDTRAVPPPVARGLFAIKSRI